MKYYLDTEFNGFGGDLISLGLVREDGESFYAVMELPDYLDPWVADNVVPILDSIPSPIPGMAYFDIPQSELPFLLKRYFSYDHGMPHVIVDWPDDIRYLCQSLITGPGTMVNVQRLVFDMIRVDAYPTTLPGAVQHNAWWDAMALKRKITGV